MGKKKDAVLGKVPAEDYWNTMLQGYPNLSQGREAITHLCSLLFISSHRGDEVCNLPGKSDFLQQ